MNFWLSTFWVGVKLGKGAFLVRMRVELGLSFILSKGEETFWVRLD